jgi:hypothetical protein
MKKMRVTFYITEAVIERAKNAAYWTPGATLSSIVESALDSHLHGMESGNGGIFPIREAELAKGRPSK